MAKIRIFQSTLLAVCLAAAIYAQGLSSLAGTVTDPTGAVVPGAKLLLVETGTGAQRTAVSDAQGRYSFVQIMPGTYRLTVQATGFAEVVRNDIQLLVNSPITLDVVFQKIGAVQTTVSVEAATSQVNTEDATIGNAVGAEAITQLPFEARNVVGLLAIQSGVIFLGAPGYPGGSSDARSGAVDGGKPDQGNVTLDGVDVNDQQNRSAFTSVLGVTLDSVQEFRTTTTNAGAESGHASGAQVTMVTRSGSNTVHGSLYEFLRNSLTSANSFFNNSSGVPVAKLDRNEFGAAVGGPIKKNKLFYFGNYEGRRDASATSVTRTVPTATFRQGEVLYGTKTGGTGTMTPAQIQAVDPAGIGVDQAVLQYFQKYPLPNDFLGVGDGLNTAGYIFNAPEPLRLNTYVAKFDYQINSKNTFFIRGSLLNENYANNAPQFPGDPSNGVYLNNSKGIATGVTTIISPTLVNTARYGLTRAGTQTTGVLNSSYADPTYGSVTTLYGTSTGTSNVIPVHDIHDDLVWTHGAHSVSFGTEFLIIHNNYDTDANSFSVAQGDGLYLAGDGDSLLPSDAKTSNTTIQNIASLVGDLTKNQLKLNYNLQGQTLPLGAIIDRTFKEQHYESYVQDSWKIKPGLTFSAGLRLGLAPNITEVNGYNVDSVQPSDIWFANRVGLAEAGQSQSNAGLVSYQLAKTTGRGLYPFQTDWAPRFALAYSPHGNSGLAKFLFGSQDRTSIRAGWGIYYDAFGEGLERSFSNAVGFATTVQSGPGESIGGSARFTGFYNLPPLSAFPPAPAGGFPQTPAPGLLAQATGLDDQLRAPYTENTNISVQRQFDGGFMLQVSYINRESHRSLAGVDVATPTNLVDSSSGMTYYQAVAALAPYVYANAPASSVPNIAFWQDLWPNASANGLTATQSVYEYAYLKHPGDWTTALLAVDNPISAATAAGAPYSGCNINGTFTSTQLPCSKLGGNTMFNSQFAALTMQRSIGKGDYNGLQINLRKAMKHGVQFDFNYTWSKCMDLTSGAESSGGGFIENPFDQNQARARCDYNSTNVFSMLAVAQLPFGKGKALMNTSNHLLNGLFGGWEINSVLTADSGFPLSVSNGGVYPTEWNQSGYATQTGIVPAFDTTSNAPSATPGQKGGPNIWSNPQAAFLAYSQTPAGQTGQRNGIIGQGPFEIDLGVGKRFNLYRIKDQQHTLQFRAESFNVTNTVRFNGASLNIATQSKFGQYSSTYGTPRVFQFALRYEF
ncbi:MAG TPA: carboxypeptidase-like regulatory domain-containing protein [Bryobacteraceae bacterium]|jgi:hypothetical protein